MGFNRVIGGPSELPQCTRRLGSKVSPNGDALTFVSTAENAPVITSISIGAATTQISRRSLTRPSPDNDAENASAAVLRFSFRG